MTDRATGLKWSLNFYHGEVGPGHWLSERRASSASLI
jgi:hypothetical protein